MLAGLRRRAVSRPRRARTHAPDAGFTLAEVVVSMMVVGVVMGALTTFYARTMSVTSYQRGKQTAVQLAADGMEEVRAIKAADLAAAAGSSPTSSCPAPAALSADVSGMRLWKQECPNPGSPYNRYWFIGDCWQPAGGGPCTQTTDAVKLIRVVVAVTWRDKTCSGSACAYATSTLISADTDPTFDPAAEAPPPVVKNPGSQSGEVSIPVNVRITGSGTPTTIRPPQDVTVTVTDATGAASSLTFEWKVTPAWWDPWGLWHLQITAPIADRADLIDQPVNVPLGTNWGWPAGSPAWTATGLPAGVELKNGILTGAPTQAGTYAVRLDVHQTFWVFGDDATFMFTWTVQ